jgi:hypothetical protein
MSIVASARFISASCVVSGGGDHFNGSHLSKSDKRRGEKNFSLSPLLLLVLDK